MFSVQNTPEDFTACLDINFVMILMGCLIIRSSICLNGFPVSIKCLKFAGAGQQIENISVKLFFPPLVNKVQNGSDLSGFVGCIDSKLQLKLQEEAQGHCLLRRVIFLQTLRFGPAEVVEFRKGEGWGMCTVLLCHNTVDGTGEQCNVLLLTIRFWLFVNYGSDLSTH